jgi:hypothetical protein
VSQQNVEELIRKFKNYDKPEKELRRKIPYQIYIEMEMVKFNAKPILILI